MEGESNFSAMAPPAFDGDNYQIWAVRMETYLDALDLWEAVEEDYEVQPLPANPTMAQIKTNKERRTRKSKAKACLFAAVSPTIFTRIMSLKSAKAIWDYLKTEYEGDERIRGMQVLNLIRDFEMQKMKESETIKEYSDKLLNIANKVRLLGSEFSDSRIVEKLLVTVPERFEATITTLENTKDLSKITLAELLSAFQAQEQRRVMRQEGTVEGALPVKHQNGAKNKKRKNKKTGANEDSVGNSKEDFPPCQHCNKKGHPPFRCWRRPDAKCTKCNQLGHEAVICKSMNQQQEEEAQVADREEEDLLFVATCFTSCESSESWLVDSGCTNHMTNDRELFKELRSTGITKVRIGNGDHIAVKGKGTVAITGCAGTKLISDVLYVPDIDQNLLSVGQLIEKGFKVLFEDNHCLIKDASNQKMFKIKMRKKSFMLDPIKEEECARPVRESVIEIWHKRLGHFHHQGMLRLKSRAIDMWGEIGSMLAYSLMAMQETAPAPAPSAEVVGNAFVEQYYHILHKSPGLVHRFYQDLGSLSRPDANGCMATVTTMQAINEKILSLNYGEYTAEIKTVDAQESYERGVIVLVTGCLTGKDDVKKKFTQTFFLAPQDKGYFVLNDVFRFVGENESLPNDSDFVNGVHENPPPTALTAESGWDDVVEPEPTQETDHLTEDPAASFEEEDLNEGVFPPRNSVQLTDMELDECEETTLHDVNIEEEMRRKQQQTKPLRTSKFEFLR